MTIHPRVAWQSVGDQVVVVDLRTGRALGLNETGSFLWTRLETHSAEQMAEALAAEFDVTAEDALENVNAFLRTLADRELISAA
jgi:hypothetical protein